MLKPTYGHIPQLQESVDNLIIQMELYKEFIHDQMEYDLATSGFDEDEAGEAIVEYEKHNREVVDFINQLKSMSVKYDVR